MAATPKQSRRRRGRATARVHAAVLLAISVFTLLTVGAPRRTEGAGQPNVDAGIANAWRVLRVVDCARCHGKDYTGLAAPSIVGYAATQSREMFVQIILDGDPIRGMPGYRSNALVVDNLDDIYRYFLARATGYVGPGYRPEPPPMQR